MMLNTNTLECEMTNGYQFGLSESDKSQLNKSLKKKLYLAENDSFENSTKLKKINSKYHNAMVLLAESNAELKIAQQKLTEQKEKYNEFKRKSKMFIEMNKLDNEMLIQSLKEELELVESKYLILEENKNKNTDQNEPKLLNDAEETLNKEKQNSEQLTKRVQALSKYAVKTKKLNQDLQHQLAKVCESDKEKSDKIAVIENIQLDLIKSFALKQSHEKSPSKPKSLNSSNFGTQVETANMSRSTNDSTYKLVV